MNSKTLSVLLMAFESEDRLEQSCAIIEEKLQAADIPYEIVIVDDGSKDNTFSIAQELAENDPNISAIQLSKNFTTPYAQFAGMSVARGACVVPIPDDLQRPIEVVIEMYRKWEQGHKIVIGYRASRADGKIRDFFSNLYYRIMNTFSEVNFPPGGADGFLADREVVDILTSRIHPKNTSTIIEVLRLGFDPYYLPYDRPTVGSKSRWTYKKRVRLAQDTFFASSSFPIKLISRLGFLTFVVCIFLILTLVYAKLFTDNRLFGLSIPGWTTIIVIIMLFSGLNLFCLGIVAEYIWRIFEEVKERPGYIIRQSTESDKGEGVSSD